MLNRLIFKGTWFRPIARLKHAPGRVPADNHHSTPSGGDQPLG